MRAILIGAALGLACLTPAWADSLASCAAIDADSARLACYDVLAGRSSASVDTSSSAAPPSAPAPPAPAVTAAAPHPAAAPPPPATAGVAEPDVIHAHIVGKFDGWNEHTRFTLDNGQVWRVTEDGVSTYRARENPAVKIKKGLLGTYFLEFDELNARVKVERVQ